MADTTTTNQQATINIGDGGKLTLTVNDKEIVIVDKDGNVTITGNLTQAQSTTEEEPKGALAKLNVDAKGGLTTEGNVTVGGEKNGAINVRHVNGKDHQSSGNDTLYLNYDTGKNVEIGKQSTLANLIVHGRVSDRFGEVMPVGSIIAFGGNTPPKGWLLCDGKTIPTRVAFNELRAIVGSKVPDLQSRFIVGAGKGSGLRKYPLGIGDDIGSEKHQLKFEEMPKHSHELNTRRKIVYHHRSFQGTSGEDRAVKAMKLDYQLGRNEGHINGTKNVGNDKAHNNLPPYYALTYIIKH